MIAFISAVILASLLFMFASSNPLVGIVPLVLVLVVYLFVALPMRAPLFMLVFLAALADANQIKLPSGVLWTPPLFGLNVLLFENLNKVLPIEALRFSLTDMLYSLITFMALIRVAFRIRIDKVGRLPGTNVLYVVMAIALCTVLWLLVWGVGARGGDFKQSLWQMRQLFWLPTVTALFAYCVRDARDFQQAINLMLTAACIKITIATKFYFTVARPMGFEPQTLTSHFDSILFVICLVSLVVRFMHAPNFRNLMLLLTVGLYILFGIVINNRRLAFVNLCVDLLIVFIIFRGPVKQQMKKILLYSLPLIAVYAVVGQRSNSKVFAPAKLIMSVVSQDDRSSDTRDIENYNLLVTLKRVKVMGAGWGHEYIEMVKADDISQFFAQYKYQAHNSILWLWTVGGLVGFTLLWMPIPLGIFLARRAYFFARTPAERSACAISLAMLVTYMMQSWGDLGTQGLNSTLTAGLALATAAKIAVSSGAFPARMRLFGMRTTLPHVEASVTLPPRAS